MIKKVIPECSVYLNSVPQSLLDGLPDEDQEAIQSMVGRLITVVGYRNDSKHSVFGPDSIVECEFVVDGNYHTIWIEATHLTN